MKTPAHGCTASIASSSTSKSSVCTFPPKALPVSLSSSSWPKWPSTAPGRGRCPRFMSHLMYSSLGGVPSSWCTSREQRVMTDAWLVSPSSYPESSYSLFTRRRRGSERLLSLLQGAWAFPRLPDLCFYCLPLRKHFPGQRYQAEKQHPSPLQALWAETHPPTKTPIQIQASSQFPRNSSKQFTDHISGHEAFSILQHFWSKLLAQGHSRWAQAASQSNAMFCIQPLLARSQEREEGSTEHEQAPIAPLKHPMLDPHRVRMPGKTTFSLTQSASPTCLHFAPGDIAPSIHRLIYPTWWDPEGKDTSVNKSHWTG